MNADIAPVVSVCIANFQGVGLLPACLESVLRQDTDTKIEIIVHDDASTDASLELLRTRFPAVRTIESESNVGYCVANNRMAAAARGRYLLLLNNDAKLEPDAIRVLLRAAATSRDILTLPQYDWESGELVDRGCLIDAFHVPTPNLDKTRAHVGYVLGACMWVPRQTWTEIGGFPEWFGSIAEDMFLCCAARLLGVDVRCLSTSGYHHRQGATFGGNRLLAGRLDTRYNRRFLSERNRISVLIACTPTALAWPWLALHAAALLIEALFMAASKGRRPWRAIYAPALRDTLRDWPRTMALRKAVQDRRRIGLLDYLRGFNWSSRKLALLLRHGLPRVSD